MMNKNPSDNRLESTGKQTTKIGALYGMLPAALASVFLGPTPFINTIFNIGTITALTGILGIGAGKIGKGMQKS